MSKQNMVFDEQHRYYGKSIPFGSMKRAMKKANTRGYFNSAQALADYAALLLHIKQRFSAHNSPIIVFGGSYGGSIYATTHDLFYNIFNYSIEYMLPTSFKLPRTHI